MSSSLEAEADICCANCGIAEVDEVKLEECACKLLRSDKCCEDHQERQDEECKNRVDELHDKELFTQPDGSHRGECPLCFLPMPLDRQKFGFWSCCSKLVCDGCVYANFISSGKLSCPFCRELVVGKEEEKKRIMERIKANDPAALLHMGTKHCDEGDFDTAFEYWTKAAELGDASAHFGLSILYQQGCSVEKDVEKEVYHLEKAAIGGHPEARNNLAAVEHYNGNIERAVKHSIIAANLGHELSMKKLWEYYKLGNVTKEKLEATLHTHHAALDEMKSHEREAAEKAWLGMNYVLGVRAAQKGRFV